MSPTVQGGCYQHPIEWFREHKHTLAHLIAEELERQFALFPHPPRHKEHPPQCASTQPNS